MKKTALFFLLPCVVSVTTFTSCNDPAELPKNINFNRNLSFTANVTASHSDSEKFEYTARFTRTLNENSSAGWEINFLKPFELEGVTAKSADLGFVTIYDNIEISGAKPLISEITNAYDQNIKYYDYIINNKSSDIKHGKDGENFYFKTEGYVFEFDKFGVPKEFSTNDLHADFTEIKYD